MHGWEEIRRVGEIREREEIPIRDELFLGEAGHGRDATKDLGGRNIGKKYDFDATYTNYRNDEMPRRNRYGRGSI